MDNVCLNCEDAYVSGMYSFPDGSGFCSAACEAEALEPVGEDETEEYFREDEVDYAGFDNPIEQGMYDDDPSPHQ